jgi:Rrf2 family protein
MALRLTNTTDYAIRGMIYIASFPPDRPVLNSEVAEAQYIPASFMAKILRSLVRAGLLASSRGVHGGFSLARPAASTSLLDVVEAVEGPISLASCVPDPTCCPHASTCPAHSVWGRVQEQMCQTLRDVTLEDLVSAPRRHGQSEEDDVPAGSAVIGVC